MADTAPRDGVPADGRFPEGTTKRQRGKALGASSRPLASPSPSSEVALPITPAQLRRLLTMASAAAATLALADLAVRAALRLELRWDTFAYHLPFAARRAGIPIPYELSNTRQGFYEGFPPLPHLVQGLLWRLTGSMNATGVVNGLAFAVLLAYAHRCLRAPFWHVTLIALSAPLVVIHAATSYVDLFGNAFLAGGACSWLLLFLFPDGKGRSVFIGGLVALALATWSKFQLVPVAAIFLCLFGAIAVAQPMASGLSRRRAIAVWMALSLVAAAPYLKNCLDYGNPFWPIKLPFVGDSFPSTINAIGSVRQRPASLAHLGQFELFWHSLFEINHPTEYPKRARWIIDQGNARIAFRMGGFWNVAVGAYLLILVGTLTAGFGRRGAYAAAGALGLLCIVACLPQSNELRYYLFLPLSGAIAISIAMRRLEQRAPGAVLALLGVSLGLFAYMVSENWVHYRIERVDQAMAADYYDADLRWPHLKRGTVYCAIDMMPAAILLTGPTLSEFTIVDRSRDNLCPPGSTPLRR